MGVGGGDGRGGLGFGPGTCANLEADGWTRRRSTRRRRFKRLTSAMEPIAVEHDI